MKIWYNTGIMNMTIKTFCEKFNGVTCPAYRGAPKADFDPNAINEAEFHDDLRFKEWSYYFDEETQTFILRWRSQSWPAENAAQEIDRMTAEISRCMRCIGFTGTAVLKLSSRAGDEECRKFKV